MSTDKREITMRFLAQPTDINFGGKVHGGTMMKWIDEAGYACAARWSGNYCVTAHMGDVSFSNPVKIGSLVEINAKVVHTGNTSVHIAVQVKSSDLKNQTSSRAIHCILIFVAMDENGKKAQVPSWQPNTALDKKLNNYAKHLLTLRKSLYQEIGALAF